MFKVRHMFAIISFNILVKIVSLRWNSIWVSQWPRRSGVAIRVKCIHSALQRLECDYNHFDCVKHPKLLEFFITTGLDTEEIRLFTNSYWKQDRTLGTQHQKKSRLKEEWDRAACYYRSYSIYIPGCLQRNARRYRVRG